MRSRQLLILAALAGCARSVPSIERAWYRVATPHVTMRSDHPQREAIARAVKLEQTWDLLNAAYEAFGPRRAPPAQLDVIAISDCDALPERFPEHLGGFVYHSHDFERRRVVVLCEDRPGRDEILHHEIAHVFNRAVFGSLPVWPR